MFHVGRKRDYDLCDELIVEIFTRLPPKSLLRFRSLSKFWYSCISSPDFIRMHKFRSQQKLLIRHRAFKENDEDEFEGFYTLHPLDQLPLCPTSGYIGTTPVPFPSCNGVVCLFDYKENSISLWNPSIRRNLPLPDGPHTFYDVVEIGFGFDPVSDDYKIVSLPRCNNFNAGTSFVYTMKTNSWCEIDSPMPLFTGVLAKACFVNGELVKDGIKNAPCLMTFDLSSHVFGTIALPRFSLYALAPTTIQGSLAVLISSCRFNNGIWVRRDASWSLAYDVTKDQVHGLLQNVFQLGTNGDLVFDTRGPGFQVRKPKIGMYSRLEDFNAAFFILDVVECLESLQLLDMGTACKGNNLSLSFSSRKNNPTLFMDVLDDDDLFVSLFSYEMLSCSINHHTLSLNFPIIIIATFQLILSCRLTL